MGWMKSSHTAPRVAVDGGAATSAHPLGSLSGGAVAAAGERAAWDGILVVKKSDLRFRGGRVIIPYEIFTAIN